MENEFNVGQKVICISENFPVINKYGGTGKEALNHPNTGEVLVINDILGVFINFEEYDSNDSINWWKYDRFMPISDDEVSFCENFAELISF